MRNDIVKAEQPPIPLEHADKIQDAITDALRALADALGVKHNRDLCHSAAIPERNWFVVTFSDGMIRLEISGQVAICTAPKEPGEDSNIVYLQRVE